MENARDFKRDVKQQEGLGMMKDGKIRLGTYHLLRAPCEDQDGDNISDCFALKYRSKELLYRSYT